MELAHKHLGHLNKKAIHLLAKGNIVKELTIKDKHPSIALKCSGCLKGKKPALPAPKERTTELSSKPLQLVFIDLVGEINPPTNTGQKYAIGILDDATRWQWQFLLKEKSDAVTAFKNWQTEIECQTGKLVKIVRTDNGREFVARKFLQHVETLKNESCRYNGVPK